jgi:hypothetical protein
MSNQDTTPKMHKWGLVSRLFDLMYNPFFLLLPTQSNSKKGGLVGWLIGYTKWASSPLVPLSFLDLVSAPNLHNAPSSTF